MNTNKTILGIDPGTNIMGYGIIIGKGTKTSVIKAGIFKLNAKKDALSKLQDIFEFVCSLISLYHPDEMAIEAPFYGKNVQSMLKLGRAQGVAIAAGLHNNVPVHEYAPRKVKMAIVGKGSASKEQVAGMLQYLLQNYHAEDITTYDASDALSIAYCHYIQSTSLKPDKSYSSWDAYLTQHPDKIVK